MQGFGEQNKSKRVKIQKNKQEVNINHLIKKAFELQAQGKKLEAAKYFAYLIKKGLNDYRVFSNYGVILKELGKLQEADVSTRKAIEISPNFAEAHLNLGNILNDLGKLQEAEVSTRKAIELKPDYAEAHSNLGNILRELGKLKEAEVSTVNAIEIKQD